MELAVGSAVQGKGERDFVILWCVGGSAPGEAGCLAWGGFESRGGIRGHFWELIFERL